MKKYKPIRSENKEYNGVKVSKNYLLFSNDAIRDLEQLKRIDISFDPEGIIEIKKGNDFCVPKSGKLMTRLTDVGMEEGRYYKIKDFVYAAR